jgi:hypothetical protein
MVLKLRIVAPRFRGVVSAAALLAIPLCLAACGGSASKPSRSETTTAATRNASLASDAIVARVGSTPITKAQVSHWMTVLGGSVYNNISHDLILPQGLLSDPPSYRRCVSTLEAAGAASPLGHTRETSAELLTKCRELNEAVRIQATIFLIGAQRTIAFAAEQGVVASPAEVEAWFKKTRATKYPTEADLRQYLQSRRRTIGDLLLEQKLELLSSKLTKKIASSGGIAALANSDGIALLKQSYQRWIEKTDCSPGYVVETCSQYRGAPTYPNRTPSALLEQVSAVVTDKCVNLAGCGKQVGE